MRESHLNEGLKSSKHDIFSQLRIPSDVPFFVRLDGRCFRAISEKVDAEKPFDERFAKCLTAAARALFQGDFNPALAYVASDEINTVFLYTAPFRRRVEKIDSVLAGIASSAFSLSALKLFKKGLIVAFDSRIAIIPLGKILGYLSWRQREAWRNHNNAYAYWLLRKTGHKPSEAAETLKGMKTKDLHDFLLRHNINLAQTPNWQRRGILVYREPYQKLAGEQVATRKQITENWSLPLLSSKEGRALIQQVLEWAKPGTGS